MNAKIKNLVNENRVRLEEVIPLVMPYSIAIDPSNVCNFKCIFCAIQKSTMNVGFKKEYMRFESYMKIVDDIKGFRGRLKILRLNGQGEPLLNPKFPEMVNYAKDADISDFIETITNGSQLNPQLNQRIVDSGIDRVRISIESMNSNGYMETANVKMNFEEFVSNVRDLYERSRGKCSIYIKTVDESLKNDEEKKKFFSVFGNISDQIFIDNVIPLWSDFEQLNDYYTINKDTGLHGQKLKSIQICPYPFYSCIINPNGDVTVCCADWQRKLIIGNAITENIVDIWNGKRLRDFWIDLASKKKDKYEMCRKCMLPTYDCNDDIDEYGDYILGKLK